jgi:hypothetical protein
MCGSHHKIIDAEANIPPYTAAYLMQLKAGHEERAIDLPIIVSSLSDEQARVLVEQSVTYEENAVHLDFRHAIFRVGGEGGHFGGGGGSGGVLTIIGSHRLPPEAIVQANGRDAVAPGGGGGGAGAVQFVGRAVAKEDIEGGLAISSIFAANAVSGEGLFNVLGGGWGHCFITAIPEKVSVRLVLVVELKGIAPEALIRLAVDARGPSGRIAIVDVCDVEGMPHIHLTPRSVLVRNLVFDVDEIGVWEFRVTSADITLAVHQVEFRST